MPEEQWFNSQKGKRTMVQFSEGKRHLSLLQHNQSCSRAYPASDSLDTRERFPQGESGQGIKLNTDPI